MTAGFEQWLRYNVNCSHMESCGEPCAEPLTATARGVADHAYRRICLFPVLGFGPVMSAADTVPCSFSPGSWHAAHSSVWLSPQLLIHEHDVLPVLSLGISRIVGILHGLI